MKRKRIMMSSIAVGAAGAAAASVMVLKDRDKRERLFSTYTDWKQKVTDKFNSNNSLPVDKAGIPDPQDEADNKMVSEGAQFGVQYYNEHKQEPK
ncbi:hypothetical protein [Aureibacillus halotolerans]|uniref:YtxH-like protein n=1 Tax=Aureibacillus halotolerans TaxID=1508390 RepID=A0A4R6U711_9BACI|nr:hypothetical protein [Aureibacillus halotolerans]TDQ42101.1 hypothetical protein EV213_102131 [Aureibacillus halotolerans]